MKNEVPLVRNNLVVPGELPVAFNTYHANKEFPCFIYQRTLEHCFNSYGFLTPEYMASRVCMDNSNWFVTCINNHAIAALERKYRPAAFVTTPAAASSYSIEDIV